MNNKKNTLEKYSKYLKENLSDMDEFIDPKLNAEIKALEARDLAEQTLANELIKETGIRIPNKRDSLIKKEDFLNKIIQERYPELKTNISIEDLTKRNAHGLYLPSSKSIKLDKDLVKNQDIFKSLGVGLHESGHQYDDQILNFDGTPDVNRSNLKKLGKSSTSINNIDPRDLYETLAEGHHAKIPKLREGTYGFGALKSLIKNGTFKSVPVVGPVLGAAIAAASGDSNAASGLPILGEAENIAEDRFSPQEEADREAASQLSSGEPLNTRRMLALKNILNK